MMEKYKKEYDDANDELKELNSLDWKLEEVPMSNTERIDRINKKLTGHLYGNIPHYKGIKIHDSINNRAPGYLSGSDSPYKQLYDTKFSNYYAKKYDWNEKLKQQKAKNEAIDYLYDILSDYDY